MRFAVVAPRNTDAEGGVAANRATKATPAAKRLAGAAKDEKKRRDAHDRNVG